MIQGKDVVLGCGCLVLIVLCLALVPLVCVALKVGLFMAVALGLVVLAILGIALLGKVIRLLFHQTE